MEYKIGKWKIKLKRPELSVASIMAGIISWSCNKSLLWMVFHYFCGLFYVIYWMCFGDCTWLNVYKYYFE